MKFRCLTALCGAVASLCLPLAAAAQIFVDGAFLASEYDTSSANLADIRFNVDYSNLDIFGDGYVVATLPPAPRTTDGSTTGLFLSANNDSTKPGSAAAAFAAAMPKGLNLGNGTANPNYVVRFDIFNSSGTGLGEAGLSGTTNYSVAGINQANKTVQIEALNAPTSGNLTGQGLALGITADSGAAEDYAPVFGGAFYRDRPGTVTAGRTYNGNPNGSHGSSGLLGNWLNNYWLAQGLGFELADSDSNPANDLNIFTGDSLYFAPDPNNTAGFLADGSGVDLDGYATAIPVTTGPVTHYTGTFIGPTTQPRDYEVGISPGIPGNRWSTHELYWVDSQFTYVVDGVPVLQITPDNDGQGGDDNVFNAFSTAGTVLLGFWDRFSSIAASPEGANFVVYDNLEINTAGAADVPDMLTYLAENGFLIGGTPADPADFNEDGFVDGADLAIWEAALASTAAGDANGDGVSDGLDLLVWQRNFTGPAAAASAIPEPTAGWLLLTAASALVGGRRRR